LFLLLILIGGYLQFNHYININNITQTEIYENFEVNNNIPRVIYLSYKTKDIPSFVIPNWKKLYPEYEVKLYDNEDCLKFLKSEYGQEFVDIFNYIKDGPIKADFWRVCVLHTYGGIYSDIDVEPLVNISTFAENDVSFITCLSANNENINPHFIASTPRHEVLRKCIEKYLRMYRAREEYEYWRWSIVFIMKDVLYQTFGKRITEEGIYIDNKKQKYQMLKEVFPSASTNSNHYCKYNNVKILNNRYSFYDSVNHKF
jgi:mannosyltransferase OCH1-like enzyme